MSRPGDPSVESNENLGIGYEKASQITCKFIAEGGGQKPDAHHNAEQLDRCQFGHRTEADWAEEHLADDLQKIEADEPERAHLAGGGGQ